MLEVGGEMYERRTKPETKNWSCRPNQGKILLIKLDRLHCYSFPYSYTQCNGQKNSRILSNGLIRARVKLHPSFRIDWKNALKFQPLSEDVRYSAYVNVPYYDVCSTFRKVPLDSKV